MIATLAVCAAVAVLVAACGAGQTAVEQPSAVPTLQPTPAASAADAPALSGAELPASITLELTLFGQQIHGFPVTDDAGKQAVMDAVHHHMLSSYALPAVDVDSLQDRIAITVKYSPDDPQATTVYYAFDRDGKHCMQAGGGMHSPISDKVYEPLLELAMGYHLPYALTVRSGKNEIKAMPHIIWSERKEDGLCADMMRYTPEQMADHIQYLDLAPVGELTPFTPFANEIKVYGNYRLYDESFEEIQFIHPSGLEPQTYLFRDCKPGKYIIEMETSFDSEESKDGYQYYFGVVLR